MSDVDQGIDMGEFLNRLRDLITGESFLPLYPCEQNTAADIAGWRQFNFSKSRVDTERLRGMYSMKLTPGGSTSTGSIYRTDCPSLLDYKQGSLGFWVKFDDTSEFDGDDAYIEVTLTDDAPLTISYMQNLKPLLLRFGASILNRWIFIPIDLETPTQGTYSTFNFESINNIEIEFNSGSVGNITANIYVDFIFASSSPLVNYFQALEIAGRSEELLENIYDAVKDIGESLLTVLVPMEKAIAGDLNGWTVDGVKITLASASNFQSVRGENALRVTAAAGAGVGTLQQTFTAKDLSSNDSELLGMWMRWDYAPVIGTAMTLKVTDSVGNSEEYDEKIVTGIIDRSNINSWHLMLFDLQSPFNTTGVIDWTDIVQVDIGIAFGGGDAGGILTLDQIATYNRDTNLQYLNTVQQFLLNARPGVFGDGINSLFDALWSAGDARSRLENLERFWEGLDDSVLRDTLGTFIDAVHNGHASVFGDGTYNIFDGLWDTPLSQSFLETLKEINLNTIASVLGDGTGLGAGQDFWSTFFDTYNATEHVTEHGIKGLPNYAKTDLDAIPRLEDLLDGTTPGKLGMNLREIAGTALTGGDWTTNFANIETHLSSTGLYLLLNGVISATFLRNRLHDNTGVLISRTNPLSSREIGDYVIFNGQYSGFANGDSVEIQLTDPSTVNEVLTGGATVDSSVLTGTLSDKFQVEHVIIRQTQVLASLIDMDVDLLTAIAGTFVKYLRQGYTRADFGFGLTREDQLLETGSYKPIVVKDSFAVKITRNSALGAAPVVQVVIVMKNVV